MCTHSTDLVSWVEGFHQMEAGRPIKLNSSRDTAWLQGKFTLQCSWTSLFIVLISQSTVQKIASGEAFSTEDLFLSSRLAVSFKKLFRVLLFPSTCWKSWWLSDAAAARWDKEIHLDDNHGSFVAACCFKIEIYCCKTAPNKETCSQTRKNDRLTQLSQHSNFGAQGCFWAPT